MTEFAIPPGSGYSFRDAVRKLREYILKHRISSVLLGVSGGADSVLALHLLAEVAKKLSGFRLIVAHANFQLRGEESLRDEKFVRKLAVALPEVKFFFKKFDTRRYALDNKISIEMAARELRHSWWDALCRETDTQLIATGHNSDDNEETMLLNLLRGSSPRGLRSMSPLGDRIFRPLLGLSRKEILLLLKNHATEYLSESQTEASDCHSPSETTSEITRESHSCDSQAVRVSPLFMTDSTNLLTDFRRNFLRNEILPQLRNRWEGLDSALQTTIELQAEAAALTEFAVRRFINDHHVEELNEILFENIKLFPAPLTLIYSWLSSHGLSTAKVREIVSHIPCYYNGIHYSPGRRWILDDGSQVVTTPTSLRLESAVDNTPYEQSENWEPEISDWKTLYFSKEIMEKIKKASKAEVYLPYPPSEYEWRVPEKGDKILLFPDRYGRRKTKLVSDVLREAGIPLTGRKTINLLTNKTTGEIVWIPGIRRAGSDLVDVNCDKIFYLNLHK